MKSTKKIRHGKVEIAESDLEPKNVKIKVTTFVDLDVLRELKRKAEAEGIGYQTLLNRILRQTVLGEKGIEERVRAVELVIAKMQEDKQETG